MPSIGQSAQRRDAFGKVTGQTLFPGDINKPDQAYMKILFAGRPHAIIRSIDTAQAEALDGVLGVFTARDVLDHGRSTSIVRPWIEQTLR